MRSLLLLAILALPAAATPPKDEAQDIAERYLKAISGEGDDGGRDLLLGGATLDAKLFTLENWRIVEREPARVERGEVAAARKLMAELDKAGRQALAKIVTAAAGSDGLSLTEVSQDEAGRLLAPTHARAKAFVDKFPWLAFVARVGKEVYWHPKNPMRPVLEQAGTKGGFTLEFHLFKIETKEGPRQVPRVWPLRVLRLRTDALDTGWKILPASDWNAD